jgi:hypothetical protein
MSQLEAIARRTCSKCGSVKSEIFIRGEATGTLLCLKCTPPGGVCPACGKRLRTTSSMQCRHCKADWHQGSTQSGDGEASRVSNIASIQATPPINPRDPDASRHLLQVVQNLINSEHVQKAGIAYWAPRTTTQGGGSNTGWVLAGGAVGGLMGAVVAGALAPNSSGSSSTTARIGIVAIGERNVFLLGISEAVVEVSGMSESSRQTLWEELVNRSCESISSQAPDSVLIVEPIDVSVDGNGLKIADGQHEHQVTAIGFTTAPELSAAITSMLRRSSPSEVCKSVCETGIVQNSDALRQILEGHDTGAQFFKLFFKLPKKTQFEILRQVPEWTDASIAMPFIKATSKAKLEPLQIFWGCVGFVAIGCAISLPFLLTRVPKPAQQQDLGDFVAVVFSVLILLFGIPICSGCAIYYFFLQRRYGMARRRMINGCAGSPYSADGLAVAARGILGNSTGGRSDIEAIQAVCTDNNYTPELFRWIASLRRKEEAAIIDRARESGPDVLRERVAEFLEQKAKSFRKDPNAPKTARQGGLDLGALVFIIIALPVLPIALVIWLVAIVNKRRKYRRYMEEAKSLRSLSADSTATLAK